MEKNKLIKTINRYYLNGKTEGAVLEIKDNTLKSNFIDDSNTCVGVLKVDDFNFNNSVLGLGNTASFLQLLKPFDDDIRVKVDDGEENIGAKIIMSDGNFNSRYYLFSPEVISKVEIDEKGLGDIALEFELDNLFINNFKKSKDAISGCNHFAIVSDNKSTRCIINYNQSTNNHILFKFDVKEKNKDVKLIFDLNIFNEILNNNTDFTESKLTIYSNCKDFDNIMIIYLKGNDWECKYYFIPKKINSDTEE